MKFATAREKYDELVKRFGKSEGDRIYRDMTGGYGPPKRRQRSRSKSSRSVKRRQRSRSKSTKKTRKSRSFKSRSLAAKKGWRTRRARE